MPTYTFMDNITGFAFDEFMGMSERETYLKDNPNIIQLPVMFSFVGDHIMGVGPKTDAGFEDRMSQIANAHPGSPLSERYSSNESHAKIKARATIEKHKKKKPLVS